VIEKVTIHSGRTEDLESNHSQLKKHSDAGIILEEEWDFQSNDH
jgi:hypothetical protein